MAETKPCPRDWKEARRLRAFALKQQGWKQQQIAVALGVSKMSVSLWMKAARENGEQSLLSRPRPGAPSRLSDTQMHLIPDFLSHGAEAYGFRGDLWTCARVAKMIAQEFGVSYHKAHVSRLLKEIDWTPQKPIDRALQRDETAIAGWRTEVWPELKKKRLWNTEPLFWLMNRGFTCCQQSLRPTRLAAIRQCCESTRPAITFR
jgi:transposase